jgi:hypothetical protein
MFPQTGEPRQIEARRIGDGERSTAHLLIVLALSFPQRETTVFGNNRLHPVAHPAID